MSNSESQIDRQGRSLLHAAAFHGDAAEVARLISAGADPSLGDKEGFTPLHLAAQQWQVDAAKALLDGGANIDVRNRHGNTPLFVAVFNSRGRGELINLLRECGANALAVNNHGQTPVGLARLISNFDVKQYFADLDESGSPLMNE